MNIKKIIPVLLTLLLLTNCSSENENPAQNSQLVPPSAVSARLDGQSIVIEWETVTGADTYNLYWSNSAGTGLEGNLISNISSPYTHTGLANDTPYYYVVTAVYGSEESAASIEVSAITPAIINPPQAPTNVTASPGDQSVVLQWSPVNGTDSYNLYWSETKGMGTSGNLIADVSSPYTHEGLNNDTPYYYVLTASNAGVESAASLEVSATPVSATPVVAVPTNFTAIAGTEQVSLSWDTVAGADRYIVYYSYDPQGTGSVGGFISVVSTLYTHTNLLADVAYHYVVKAESNGIQSEASAEVIATPIAASVPAIPTGLEATAGAEMVTLSWSPAAGAVSYNLYWSNTSASGTSGTLISDVSSPYTHSGLTVDSSYYYVLTAVNSAGESSPSTEVNATPSAIVLPPARPGNPMAVAGDSKITLSWDAVPDANSYTLYSSTTRGVGTQGQVINNVSSPYIHSNLNNGTKYYYVITASNIGGESPATAELSAIPEAPNSAPKSIDWITAQSDDRLIELDWEMVPGATSYNIHWSNTPGLYYSTPQGSGFNGQTISVAGPPYKHNNLNNGQNHYYIVEAVKSLNLHSMSSEVSASPSVTVDVKALSNAVELQWTAKLNSTYNVYYSSVKDFDPDNLSSYADGNSVSAVTAPLHISGLSNGVTYYFVLEEIAANSSRSRHMPAMPDSLDFNDSVDVTSTDGNGRTYLAGPFTRVGAHISDAILLSTYRGKASRLPFPRVYGDIKSSTGDGQGGWYIAGQFNSIGGVSCQNVAHVLADGSVDTNFLPDVNGIVDVMLWHDNVLYIAGEFTSINTQARVGLAAFDSTGALTNWSPTPNDRVKTLEGAGPLLYAGGAFTEINGQARMHAAAIGVDGSLAEWAPAINNTVNTLAVSGQTIYVGGKFTQVNGERRVLLAAIDASGALGGLSTSPSGEVTALAVHNGVLYYADTVRGLLGINADGTTDWKGEVGGVNGGTVNAIVVHNNRVYAASDSDSLLTANYVYGVSTSIPPYWGAYLQKANTPFNTTLPIAAKSISVQGDKLLVAGNLAFYDGVGRNNLAAIEADGSLSSWVATGSTSSDTVTGTIYTILAEGNRLYVGGNYSVIAGDPRNSLSAFDDTGQLLSWNPGVNQFTVSTSNSPGIVYAMTLQGNTLYFGGSFSRVGADLRFSLAAVDVDGNLTAWDPRSGIISISPDGTQIIVQRAGGILSMESSADTIYLGGSFTYIGGQPRNKLAAVGIDGQLSSWDPDIPDLGSYANPNNNVRNMLLHNNTLYVTGHIDRIGGIGGIPRSSLAAIGIDGTVSDWAPSLQLWSTTLNKDTTYGFSLDTDGTLIYVAGNFETANGAPRFHLAAFDFNGVLQAFSPNLDGFVSNIEVVGDKIKLSGDFQNAEINQRGYATVNNDGQYFQ